MQEANSQRLDHGRLAGAILVVSVFFWWIGLQAWATAQYGYLDLDVIGSTPFLWVLLIAVAGLTLLTRLLPRGGTNVVAAIFVVVAAAVLAVPNIGANIDDGNHCRRLARGWRITRPGSGVSPRARPVDRNERGQMRARSDRPWLALACVAMLAACSSPPSGSPASSASPTLPTPSETLEQVVVAVTGTAPEPPEPLLLHIDDQAWHGYGGVVGVETRDPVTVRLVGQESCREYASFSADPGTNWVVRFTADESAAVEDWTGRGMDAGPALGEREARDCQVPTPSSSPRPSPSPSPGAAAPRTSALVLPAFIADRAHLPWCGHELVERRADGDFYDAEVRACFLTAYEAGEQAEFVTDGLTVEGGRIRRMFRALGDGAIEVIVDSSGDPLGTPGWTRTRCESLDEISNDPEGVPIFVGGNCSHEELIDREPSPNDVTAEELRTIENVIAFASAPGPKTAAAVPWADEVLLGLADQIVVSHHSDAIADPANWVLEREAFRGRVGPFSALDALASWDRTGIDSISELTASAGPHPHCASPPVAAPAKVDQLHRVSVQPVGAMSCLTWWTVDLYLDGDGLVAAVTLDVYEP